MSQKPKNEHTKSKELKHRSKSIFLNSLKYYFSRDKRILEKDEQFQKELNRKTQIELSALLAKTSRKYYFVKTMTGLLSVGVIATVVSAIFKGISNIGLVFYNNFESKYSISQTDIIFAYITFGVLLFLVLMLVFIAIWGLVRSMSKLQTEIESIKSTIELKNKKANDK
ncbi:hypothetical protein OZX69_09665 (plasmid) [Lactobacillus sp. ESL0731]|uniref:hypothetical protein n=1 Tax=unclassified Lactobacillus TaxID=2620435 RepID=UPI0023F7EB84|nr:MULTISPECIES: hypothetical protein [unclassified Lactobacillus]WEV52090.1 hypothetical protein OZX63_09660 [Lactobacillus sp. ESL0700]WEV63219.1 hypothetical protein OZX69_09665 [Lactobacillus sp. ESL0731]